MPPHVHKAVPISTCSQTSLCEVVSMTRRPNETVLRRLRKRSRSLPPVPVLSRHQVKSEGAEMAVVEGTTCSLHDDAAATWCTNCMIGAVRIAFTVSGVLFMLLLVASNGALYVELFY